MTDAPRNKAQAIPASRIGRVARMGAMAAGVAGNMGLGAVTRLGRGERPDMRSLLLTPSNIRRVTDELARMRGAAMKVGQLMSMDTGDILPPELHQIMARLRAEADFMPPAQLKKVLTAALSADWLRRFARFDPRPIAAASIGQVHRAVLKSGEEVALKVQYPGIARSIDSDVANVGALIRLSGLVPKGLDLAPLLEEARLQLHEETDYVAEAAHLTRFAGLLEGDARFRLPRVVNDLTTETVLTMSFEPGAPIESVREAPQQTRNAVAETLMDLCLTELFTFRLSQTDPNFANYLWDSDRGQIVLLDFGATRAVPEGIAAAYADFLRAGMAEDWTGVEQAASRLGLLPEGIADRHRAELLSMMTRAFEHLRAHPVLDFTDQTLSREMQARGIALAEDGFAPPAPPGDVLFLQRKFAGLYLLGAKLGANVPVSALLARHL